jgi:hypothetical protein
MPDFTVAIRKLAVLNDNSPYERVYTVRRILDNVYREGYEEGYQRAMQDRSMADLIANKVDDDAAFAEGTNA